MSKNRLQLFRVFFPSWKFFERITEVPLLFYRVTSDGENFDEWQPVLERPKRSLVSLFVNPQGNLFLACGSLLEQLLSDMQDVDDENDDKSIEEFQESVSFKLVTNLVLHKLSASTTVSAISHFQFKICSVLQGSSEKEMQDVVISGVCEVR